MLRDRYHLLLEMRVGDEKLTDAALKHVDWTPAIEAARFAAVCQAGWPPELAYAATESLRPHVHSRLGKPYLGGFEVILNAERRDPFHYPLALRYFQPHAQGASQELIKQGRLQAGQEYGYLVAAYERELDTEDEAAAKRSAITLSRAPNLSVLDRPAPFGVNVDGELAEPPFLIHERVVEEINQLAREATDRECETAGMLLGNVCRDPAGFVYVEATAQVPARKAESTLTSVSFTPACWSDLSRTLELRKQPGECAVGWWHSHCVRAWRCKDCPEERQRSCPLAHLFSADDEHVHRQFSKAFQAAAVVSDVPFQDEPILDVYGWSHGLIAHRDYLLVSRQGNVFRPYHPQMQQEEGEACQNEESTA